MKNNNQLASLTEFIIAHTPDWLTKNRSSLFQASIGEQQILLIEKDLGLGKQLGILQYQVLLSWERFPFRQYAPQQLFALVIAWLNEHADGSRDQLELQQPEVDIELLDEDNAIVAIMLELAEAITVIEDKQGNIPYEGKRWKVAMPNIYLAEQAKIIATNEHGISPDQGKVKS